ncbi:signal transduction histidine kinase [Paraburkholderia tropica]|nr:signal transduction histidine kinase [Paraburkholderia tropica]MBB6323793.1 signal transduction histidine kinase [Paraburkholderia tropica]
MLKTAAATGKTKVDDVSSGADAVVAVACPVPHHRDLLAWTLTRARSQLGPYGERAATILSGFLIFIVLLAFVLALALRRWKRNLTCLETALAEDVEFEQGKRITRLGERDLDQIVEALNRYVDPAERFSALGKMAAQIAHEIRNPAGAMRLKAENALAGDDARREAALKTIIEQGGSIESQVTSLLALTQPVTLQLREVDLNYWLGNLKVPHEPHAQNRQIDLNVEVAGLRPVFDTTQMARALDNLIVNALRHAPPGGYVKVTGRHTRSDGGERLRFEVSDNGPGVRARRKYRRQPRSEHGLPWHSAHLHGLARTRLLTLAQKRRSMPPYGSLWVARLLHGSCWRSLLLFAYIGQCREA